MTGHRAGALIALLALSALIVVTIRIVTRPEDPPGMIWLPGGSFVMGSDRGLPDEAPAHTVRLDGFWIDRYETSNRDFLAFVEATGYRTTAEELGDSLVFVPPAPDQPVTAMSWWQLAAGIDWRQPQGEGDSVASKLDHPVVQVSYDDALAYCDWRGSTLPTEAQFEYAARGGREREIYSWGDATGHREGNRLNFWQGNFPYRNDNQDGYATTAPIGSFPANDFGLYDITGNVWEWVSDWYHPRYYAMSPVTNPAGVEMNQSVDPNEPGLPKRSIRGGSFLCAENYCSGFRVSARMPAHPQSSTSHTGFRCVRSATWLERLGR